MSLYDTAEAAELTARSYPWMGTFIARLEISDNAPIVARQTLKSGHFSVVGDPAELLARVAQVLPIP